MSHWIENKHIHPPHNERVLIRVWDNKTEKEIEIEVVFKLYHIDENTDAWSWTVPDSPDYEITCRPTHWKLIEE